MLYTWHPIIPRSLTEHFAQAVGTSELLGQALIYRDAADQGFKAWLESRTELERTLGIGPPSKLRGEGIEVPAQVAALDVKTSFRKLGPMPHTEAWKFFKDRVPMKHSEYLKASKRWKEKALYISDLEKKYVLNKVRGEARKALNAGQVMEDFRKEVEGIFERAGIRPTRKKLPGKKAAYEYLGRHHIETVYQNNIHTAVNGARWRELNQETGALAQFFPLLQYLTVQDDAVRDEHAALHGYTARRNDAIWQQIYPPNGHNCRCLVVEISEPDIQKEKIEPSGAMPEGANIDPDFNRAPEI